MNLKILHIAIASALVAGTTVVLAEDLPKAMSGNWNGVASAGNAAGRPIGGRAGIVIQDQAADGTLRGTMSFQSSPSCSDEPAPMTGTFDGTELKLHVDFKGKYANAG